MYQVIIVDDDPMVSYINRGLVEKDGSFSVTGEFRGAQEALAFLYRQPAELLILDLNLSGYDGLDLLRDIRAKRMPVDAIAITAANDAETVGAAFRLGVIDYLIKPFSGARFQTALDRYKRYITAADGLCDLSQRSLDEVLRPQYAFDAAQRGGRDQTLNLIMEKLTEQGEAGTSVEELARHAGISRVTVRQYMGRLVESGRVLTDVNYNTGGRPCVVYRLI